MGAWQDQGQEQQLELRFHVDKSSIYMYIYFCDSCLCANCHCGRSQSQESRAYQKFLSHYLLMPFTRLFVIIILQLGRFICQMLGTARPEQPKRVLRPIERALKIDVLQLPSFPSPQTVTCVHRPAHLPSGISTFNSSSQAFECCMSRTKNQIAHLKWKNQEKSREGRARGAQSARLSR